MKQNFYLAVATISIMVFSSGCVTLKVFPNGDATDKQGVQAFPADPDQKSYSSAPVVKRLPNGNYEVTPEMVSNATVLANWKSEVVAWKTANKIK